MRLTRDLELDLDLRPLITAVVVGVGSAVLGMRVVDALLIGLVTLVLAVVGFNLDRGLVNEWPPADLEEYDGTRREISALTWSFVGRDGRVSEAAVRRLRAVATRRLARQGVVVPGGVRPPARRPAGDPSPADAPVDEPTRRARELLGERAWATLTGSGGWMPSLHDVAACVDRLERLGTTPSDERPAP